ncbi:MAG: DUF3619 family protein [Pseudomonadota bacterium]
MNTDNRPDDFDPKKIAAHLTAASKLLDENTLSALQRGRNRALEKQLRHRPVVALSTGHHEHHWMPHTMQQWLLASAIVLAILVGSMSYWHHAPEPSQDSYRLDIAILTDDLPMDVFID